MLTKHYYVKSIDANDGFASAELFYSYSAF
jgi:hypothetical protein